jgi:hypothetical protein
VHSSSELIGTIAGALAKAQAELTNPEKSLSATIRSPSLAKESAPSATLRYRVASTSFARVSAGMRSLPYRRPQSIRTRDFSA